MASYGGETPVSTNSLVLTSTGTAQTYTVPSGKYARITLAARHGGVGSPMTVSIAGTIVFSSNTGTGSLYYSLQNAVVLSGQIISIQQTSGDLFGFINAVEYNNPS